MAYKDTNGLERGNGETSNSPETLKLKIMDEVVELPHDSFVRDADITRESMDLVLESPEGTIIIEDYFGGFESPALTAPSGASLSPQLVNSFISGGNEYASTDTANDVSPIGAVQEISGDATITRADGTTEELSIGSPVYQGDVIETDADSALNITFVDESSFAVSEETRLAIDEYVFDPASQGGVQNFSVLKGVFVYTSGLIGREDPDDVAIETPVGSIGIRGTIIAGDVDKGEITVVEGAIVLRNPLGEEMTLASQFETGKFMPDNKGIVNLGQKSANDVVEKFSIVSKVAPTLFSSINDAAAEDAPKAPDTPQEAQPLEKQPVDAPLMESEQPIFDADGTTDQNNDSQVDGTINETDKAEGSEDGAMMEPVEEQKQEPLETDDIDLMHSMTTDMEYALNMDGTSSPTGTTTSTMGSMETMTAMSMTNDDMMTDGETAMEMLDNSMNDDAGTDMMVNNDPYHATNNDTIDNSTTYYAGGGSDSGTSLSAPQSLKYGPLSNVGVSDFHNKSIAPNKFFASSEDNVWSYNFDKEFAGQNIDGYQLSSGTVSFLNGLVGTILNGWSFGGSQSGWADSTTHGNLMLDFSSDFSGVLAAGNNISLNIDVAARNSGGSSGFTNYGFNIYNDDITISTGGTFPVTASATSEVINSQSGLNTNLFLSSSTTTTANKTIFLGDGTDNVTIGGLGMAVTNNTINLGNGVSGTSQTVTTISGEGNIDNTIIGGDNVDDNDTFVLGEVQGHFHGMDGDDIFQIDLADATTGNALWKLNNLSSGILLDGGHSNFRAHDIYHYGSTTSPGMGDTLRLNNNGSIDFTAINDDFIKGIERIDLGVGNVNVTLNATDVINMTDSRNTLLFRGDSGDSVTVTSGFTLQQSGYSLDDGTGTANYDIYTNGNITLIVEDAIVETIG
jgi:hypothetical protein